MQLVSGVMNQAVREGGYLPENPMASVRRPAEPPSRDRLPIDRELEALAISAGSGLSVATARTYHAFLFAIETGMRSGEIVGLRWDDVDLAARVTHMSITKNVSARCASFIWRRFLNRTLCLDWMVRSEMRCGASCVIVLALRD
ncbi:tyrosine-type recombinase/integrase [Loktanella agnita]